MYVRMYVCMTLYVCMYVCMYVCTYVHRYVGTYVGMYVCMHVCVYCVCKVCLLMTLHAAYVHESRWAFLCLLTQTGAVPGRRFRHAMAAGPDGRVFMFGGENVDSA